MKNLENTSTQNSNIEKANEIKRYNAYEKDVSEKARWHFKRKPYEGVSVCKTLESVRNVAADS